MLPLPLALVFACGAARSLPAQSPDPYPLPESAGNTTPQEGTAPYLIPVRCVQTKIADKQGLIASQGLPTHLGVWDMIAVGPDSRYVFVPCESQRSGLFRLDTQTGDVRTIFVGNGLTRTADPLQWDPNNDNYKRLDPATLTPWGSLLTAEEEIGGRLFEILDPYAPDPSQKLWRTNIPSMRHEGLRFDADWNLYFVDEWPSGSIYKFVPVTPGDMSVGQTFVLSVDAFASDPNAVAGQNWNSTSNQLTTRTGPATWVPITDPVGNALTVADPFVFVTNSGGRDAADEVFGTPFGRPEDIEVGTLANGNECLYVALTSEDAVLAIEFLGPTSATVRYFVERTTPNLATGTAIGAELDSPDNLATDAFGAVYIVEDFEPGDVFKAIDEDRDGVAEAVGRVLSCGVAGSEPSGLIFDPNDPYKMWLTVMSPSSGNDSLWTIQTRPYPGHGDPFVRLMAGEAGSLSFGPAEFVTSADPGEALTLAVDPAPVLNGNAFAVIAQPFVTSVGAPAFLPPLWVDPAASIVLLSGSVGSLPASPPYGGNAVTLPVPAGLQGLSVLAQAAVLPPAFGLVFSDAVEILLL